jgi:hypothetical protein
MKINLRFIYRIRDPEQLRLRGNKTAKVGVIDENGKRVTGVIFPFKYFPVMNVIMNSVVQRLNFWKKVPEELQGKYVSIIGIIAGKYIGFKHIEKLIEGAELWK